MGRSSPSVPQEPDPAATARAQGATNKNTAIAQSRLNQVDEYTPYGSSVYSPTGEPVDGIQRFRRDTTLDPAQQGIVDQQTAISGQLNSLAGDQVGRVSESLATPFSYDGMPAAPQADTAARQQVIDSLYSQAQSRLDPQYEQLQTTLKTDLANQGIGVGSDAYNQSMESFGRTRTDAYNTALNQATVGGGSEQSRLFGLQGNARERAIQEASYLRGIPLNEASALMGSSPGVSTPQFSPTPQTAVGGTDITGPTALAYQGQLNQYNQQRSANNAFTGGLFGLAGSALGGYTRSGGTFGF